MLKSPIQLSSSVRDMDGIPIALANTIDGGSAVVVWKNSSWVLSKGFDVSDVMRSPEANTSKNYPKLLNEYIFFGKPESQLPREMIPLSKVKNNQKENTSTKKENKFKLLYVKFTQKYPLISILIIFFLLFYVAIKLLGFILGLIF